MIGNISDIQKRAEKLLSKPIKFFYHPDFDKISQHKKILSDLPSLEKYESELSKIHKFKNSKISAELRPCYQAPLLTFEQEQHLFKKMNFFKYKASKLAQGINPFKISENKLCKIESLLDEAAKLRNQIAECNFRLATQLLRGKINFYRDNDLVDSLLSDAYFDVLKSVDYFNWTLGNKFSTYATWAVKTNFYRDCKQKIAEYEKTVFMDEYTSTSLPSRGIETEDELILDSNKKLVSKLLGMLESDAKNPHRNRQILVLKYYFGIEGDHECTLEEIAKKIGISKERVRQLKAKGLDWLQKEVKKHELCMDDLDF